MKKVKVLFFAADPLSSPPNGHSIPLGLAREARLIRKKVRLATYRDVLDFDTHWAVRTDDLLQALSEAPPQVVHFSGHGGAKGLVLMDSNGSGEHCVGPAALAQLFKAFRGDIRLVVLTACSSLPHAQAIADVVGCAIGTHSEISDEAAIIFSASFYRAVAFGDSIKDAHEKACSALKLQHFDEGEWPQLVAGQGVDPANVILIPEPPEERRPTGAVRRVGMGLGTLVLVTSVVVAILNWPVPVPACAWDENGTPHLLAGGPPTWVGDSTTDDASGSGTDLEVAKAFHRAGNDKDAFPHFRRAAQSGNPEATGLLGVSYLCGEGIARQTDLGISLLRKAASKGDARGMTALAFAYQHGIGVDRSHRWARYWGRIAADRKKWPDAMRNLGGLFLEESQYDSALVWYERAIHARSLDAMVDLGFIYETGRIGPRDPGKARRFYEMAATAGSARGMFEMGRIYQDSVGVPRDYVRAMGWYQKAVAAGSINAMNAIGVLYQNGWGVPLDSAQAIYWFKRAESAGSELATNNLSVMGAY